jgi:F-box interacting protein
MTTMALENDGPDTSLSFLLGAIESVKSRNDQLITMDFKKDQDFLELHLRRASESLERCIDRLKETIQREKGQDDSSSSSIPEIGQLKIFFSPSDEPSKEYYFYAWQPGGDPVKKLMRNEFLFPIPLTRPLHGIVLLHCDADDYRGGYYVCNPSTGALLLLPDSYLPLKQNFRAPRKNYPRPLCYFEVAYGFGYCSTTNEYKVVRLFSNEVDETIGPCCEVFVLDKLAYWRPSVHQPPPCTVEDGSPAVFIKGHLHFLCRDGGITVFNISDESFCLMPPPPNPKDHLARMTELDGCLCVYHGGIADGDGPYHIWMLRDYEARRWEHLCCIDTTAWPEHERMELKSGWIDPLGMYNGANGEKKIVFETDTCKVFVVDLHSNLLEIIFRPEESIAGRFDNNPGIRLLEESLVPLGRTMEEMILSSPITKAWSDVLKWLPARSVSELSLVSREWRAVVTSDCFIRSHAVHANSIDRPLAIKFVDPALHYFIDVKDMVSLSYQPNIRTWTLSFFMCEQFECSQPCHGLNLASCDGAYFLCNPAMGYRQCIKKDDNKYKHIALGYDSERDVHVLVHPYVENNLETGSYILRCSRLYTNEYKWEPIDPPPRPVADVPPVYADGKIYWMVHPDLGPTCELVALNTMDYEFEMLQGPPCLGDGRVSMLELNGAICVAFSDRDADAIDLWMMKDDMTWCVEYRIELSDFSSEYSSEKTTVMGVDPTDGRILLNTGKALGYYDPNTLIVHTIYCVPIQSEDSDNNKRICPVIFQESLLRPFMKNQYILTDSEHGDGSGLQVDNPELLHSLPSEERNATVEMVQREAREVSKETELAASVGDLYDDDQYIWVAKP